MSVCVSPRLDKKITTAQLDDGLLYWTSFGWSKIRCYTLEKCLFMRVLRLILYVKCFRINGRIFFLTL